VFPATLETQDEMDIDRSAVVAAANVKLEAETMVEVDDEAEELDEEEEEDEEEAEWNENWTVLSPAAEAEAVSILQGVRDTFQDEVDEFDTTMVAEYADDIFAHMEAMELTVMPNPNYMDHQTEIEW
jgi:G2/mitotic-specific cyclin 1/2